MQGAQKHPSYKFDIIYVFTYNSRAKPNFGFAKGDLGW